MSARELITEHLDLWTGAVTQKSSSGRGSNGKVELTGVKKLRELILELAVRGKLVDQSQEDEPSSELLKKIIAEKTKRIESGEIKKPKKLPAIDEVELPFQIPTSWKFIRLGEAVDIIRGITFPASEKSKSPAAGRLACLRTTNVQDTIEVHDLLYIKESFVTKNSQYIQKNDIVMSMANSRELVGKVAFVEEQSDEPMTFGGFLGVLRPTLIHPKFLMAVLRAPHSRKALIGNASQTTNIANISIGKLNPLVIGLPPLEEQHRIVQKVDELMALCDRLEQQTSDQLEAHETLVDTLLGTLTQSENATELAGNWARLAAHFDTLFTTEQSIDKLKQTILQLAVMGRLVEQDAGDEPTESLLTKIDQEITSLVKQGHIKKPKPAPEISDNDKFFEIPDSWQWVRLGSLALHSEAGWSPKCHDAPRENQSWAVLKVSAVTWGEFRPEENKELPANLTARPEYEVQPADFLISRANTSELVARSVVVPDGSPAKLMMSDKIIRFIFSKQVEPLFLNLFNNSPFARSYYLSVAGGTSSSMKNVSRAQIQTLAVPLPSRAEQMRIVQKVDELTALCDKLKERLNQAGENRCQLAATVVDNALH